MGNYIGILNFEICGQQIFKNSAYAPDREWNITAATAEAIMENCELIHTGE